MTPVYLADEHSSPQLNDGCLVAHLTFRTLTRLDIPAFRTLRLEALRLHPETFVPTYEEAQSEELRAIARRFRNDWIEADSFILGAYVDDGLVGAIGIRRATRQKLRHKATIWLLYTETSVRGLGIGRMLLEEVITRCRRDHELELLQLTVGHESQAAHHLYVSVGFETYGVERHAMKVGERYIDVMHMVFNLRPDSD